MLTRLRVKGFKNLVDVDVRFGRFTCIAGPNGVGKSNLFDAITFLGDLASMPIMKAASRARGAHGRISDFHSLFFKDSKGEFLPMLFIAKMIVPGTVTDDFDRPAKPIAILFEALTAASGLNSTRKRRFNPHQYKHRVSELNDDLALLRKLQSFNHFEAQIQKRLAIPGY